MQYDLILSGGLVIDGTGKKPYTANVCIENGKIACITTEKAENAKEIVDVSGLAVTPGFIDTHSHSDANFLLDAPTESKLAQGVTTEIIGNCGMSVLPATEKYYEELDKYVQLNYRTHVRNSVSDYASDVEAKGLSINCGMLVGHSMLRMAVMGFVNRDPSEQEMEQLKNLLDRELRRGAKGMSLGLIYPPSAFSSQEELVELSKVIAKHGGLLAVHMRNEGAKVFEAVDEMIAIARLSGAHVHISHLKLMGKPQWGRSTELLQKIRDARNQGIHITCDQYPFHASSTMVTAMVPHWAHAGGPEELMRRLRQREGTVCEEIRKEMDNRGGPHAVLVVNTRGAHPAWEGMYMDEIARELGVDPVDAVIRVTLETKTTGECIYFSMDAQDVMNIMQEPYICVGSDGNALSYDKNFTTSNVHPRHFAAFSQFFQTVRENGLMPIEKAVHKATGLAAEIMSIHDRGILAEGMAADIAVFDPETYESRSTFMESRVPPVGVHHVLVNGKFALRDGHLTQARNGKVI